ncbi:hypothetical protein Q7C18_07510 [Nesterenkonia sp. CL21]|uniref:hypothetical protein n=1 Tax=Nesterenkonia sp. CL21 TaxID=3064894 RepID=UPI002879D20D|nr:hypothetical protein [Nesterenkonia sp. CL21]MDS2172536.1 hypothetical protein [Nesterenkonia sp. CL21]
MSELSPEEQSQLRELIQRSDLAGIQFHELSAKLHSNVKAVDPDVPEEADVTLRYQTRAGENLFGVRAQVELTSASGEAKAVVAAEYELNSGLTPAPELLELFATEVGMMTLFPYLREGISSATSRVFGRPVLLPVLQRGQIRSNDE